MSAWSEWSLWLEQWADVRRTWTRRFHAMYRRARALAAKLAEGQVEIQPFVDRVQQTLAVLEATDQLLTTLEGHPRHSEWVAESQMLRAGLFLDATLRDQVGALQVLPVVTVGLVVLGVLGLAWAWVAHPYALAHLQHVETVAEELTVRVDLEAQGRELPPSTLPLQTPVVPSWTPPGWMFWALGLGAMGVVAWWGGRR